jgi:hypothetical protein
MSEPAYVKQFKQLSSRYMRAVRLEKIDQHESLTFLHRNYNVYPSEIITLLTFLFILAVLVLDGFNIVAAVVGFLLPLLQCLGKLGSEEAKKPINFIHSNVDEGSRLTDE